MKVRIKHLTLIASVIGGVIVLLLMIWIGLDQGLSMNIDRTASKPVTAATQETPRYGRIHDKGDTGGRGLRQVLKAERGLVADETLPYTAEIIFEALQQVNVNESGDVIVDENAVVLLNRTIGHRTLKLDAVGLAELQALIEIGMPGKAGQQTALIAGKYYNLILAEREFEILYSDAQLDYDRRQQLVSELRETYLGEELARQLYAVTDAKTDYLYQRFVLAGRKDMDADERRKVKQNIEDQYVLALAESVGLGGRYQTYLRGVHELLQQLKAGGVSDKQVDKSVGLLWQSHFTDQERIALMKINIKPVM
jgi:hypothetical protein